MELKTLQQEMVLASTLAERDMMILDMNNQINTLRAENEDLKKRLTEFEKIFSAEKGEQK